MKPFVWATLAVLILPLAALADDPPRPVVTEIVAGDSAPDREIAGTIASQVETALSFQTLGRLRTRLVGTGDSVTTGEELAQLDQVSLQQDVDAATAALASAQVQKSTADTAYDRASALQQRGSLPQAQLDAAEQSRASAASSVAQAQATLAAANDALSFSVLRAPSDGVIIATMAEAGDVVSAGTPVMRMVDTTRREVLVDLPESYAAALQTGQQFRISIRTEGVAPVTGSLRLIEPVSDASLRFRRAHLALPEDAPTAYRVGMIANVALEGAGSALLTLPTSAVIAGPTPAVWRVSTNGAGTRTVTRTDVSLGETLQSTAAEDRVVIAGGLNAGDEIVVRGVNSLTDGQTVGPSTTIVSSAGERP
ncbi:protein secretion protein [Ketogulonicigenium robustum]|uniref:Protein secretion protein n=1 Tax=Ketogulonicigenium robustum TaxID=92947 RepID=A0A1W6NWU3_9RHOB|nr:efflux RND transporter periplasmic adaptor subunit [Ketogulonicigenium robustum]ARO13702.1 protein secretion protein [Ketogulonicigenium robustum]